MDLDTIHIMDQTTIKITTTAQTITKAMILIKIHINMEEIIINSRTVDRTIINQLAMVVMTIVNNLTLLRIMETIMNALEGIIISHRVEITDSNHMKITINHQVVITVNKIEGIMANHMETTINHQVEIITNQTTETIITNQVLLL